MIPLPGDVPVEPGRDEARRAALAELSDPDYADARPSLVARALRWLGDTISDLLGGLMSGTPGGFAGLILFALLLVVLVLVVRHRVGPIARRRRVRPGAVFTERPRTAAAHRLAADEARDRGDLAEAVRERFRAVVRELEERGVLDERPGRTADEAAEEAGHRQPRFAGELRSAARLFDDVHYGGRAATEEEDTRLAELDAALRANRRVAL